MTSRKITKTSNDRPHWQKCIKSTTILFCFVALTFSGIQTLCGGEAGETNNCKSFGCPKESKCRDIFGHHPAGLAVDISGMNDKLLCSFGTYFDPSIDTVIGDTNNLVCSLHKNFLKTAKGEGATIFSPLGAFYLSEGEWNKLPPLFTKVLYEKGEGDQNCVIHFHSENPKKPPLVLLRLGNLWLGDKKTKVFDQYGKATEVLEFPEGVTAYVFVIGKQKKSYVAIEVFPYDKDFIWSIQISGEDKISLKGLMGINIGSKETDLLAIFGKPTESTAMTDVPGELLTYKGRNYSFELNEKKRVRSLKIVVPESFMHYVNK